MFKVIIVSLGVKALTAAIVVDMSAAQLQPIAPSPQVPAPVQLQAAPTTLQNANFKVQ